MSLLAWLTIASLSPTAHAMPQVLRQSLDPQLRPPVFEFAAGLRKSVPEVPANKQGAIRHAITRETDLDLTAVARWQTLSDGRRVGQARFLSPTAASVALSFSRASLPSGARIWLEAADGTDAHSRPLTARDTTGGVLFTPVVRADELLVTIVLPAGDSQPTLQLAGVHVGVRPFATLPPPPQGTCNVDVVCPEATGWEAEIDTVAVYGFSGDFWCTGFMLNNTAEDETPYFGTARHCGIDDRNASSMTVYWNYESEDCGDLSGGQIRDYQTGATWRMEYRSADWTLVELSSSPDPTFEVAYAGWDRTGTDSPSAVAIHHPGTDEKAISFEDDPTTVTDDYDDTPDSSGSHVRVDDWDQGTTEGGSSGSPLFSADHQVIGTLTGGWAACGNNEPDWYGRLYTAWTGDGSSDGRLSDWLDASGTGQTSVDTLAPHLGGVFITPSSDLSFSGPVGGPFTPDSERFELLNRNDTTTSVAIAVDVGWAEVSDTDLALPADSSGAVTVSMTDAAAALSEGRYTATLTFSPSDGSDPETRAMQVVVGTSQSWYRWNLDDDPGWDAGGDWEWGVPEGRGGDEGGPDPTSGATGDHVYGYNLAGDYDDQQRARYLSTPALDFTDAIGTRLQFQRWLGVEESAYDKASVELTNDGGSNWYTIWSNSTEVADREWQEMDLDISTYADGEGAVQVRWVMGSTDESVTYCGWNIDDIEFVAVGTPPDPDTPEDTGTPEPEPEPDDTGEPAEPTEPDEPAEPTEPSDSVDTADPDSSGKALAPGAISSCACSASSATGAGGWLLLGLGAVGIARRRRRD